MKHRHTLTIGLVPMVAALVGCETHKSPTEVFIEDNDSPWWGDQPSFLTFAPARRMEDVERLALHRHEFQCHAAGPD